MELKISILETIVANPKGEEFYDSNVWNIILYHLDIF